MTPEPSRAEPTPAPHPPHPVALPGPVEAWALAELQRIEAHGLSRALEPLSSPQGPVVELEGRRYVNFSANDYLGLAADPAVAAAARTAAMRHGFGSGASRLIVGDSEAHQSLEAALARTFKSEAALLFNSGYQANSGVLSTLLGKGDVVFSDALNHASIVDGCRLSKAEVVIYPHRDVKALAPLLAAHAGRRRVVVTDAVFSMDGDRAPLVELAALCRKEGAALVVDEAHAVGVLGPAGGGLCELLEVSADVRVGTLGKAYGSFGAFALCSANVRRWLLNRARSLIFSTSLPPSVCAAAEAGLKRSSEDPSLRARLWHNIERFAAGLERLGLPAHRDSAIFSVVLGDNERALAASKALRERGVLAKPIRPPTVPKGTARLRFALAQGHTDEHLDRALEALEALAPRRAAPSSSSAVLPAAPSPRAVTLTPFTPSAVEGAGEPRSPR